MRRLIPRKTDLATISNRHFTALLQAYNATPRKCLDFKTPAELFLDQLLHFKCESTRRAFSTMAGTQCTEQRNVALDDAMRRQPWCAIEVAPVNIARRISADPM